MPVSTRAAARRWLDAHVGQTIDTHQVFPSGRTWEPGPRLLTKRSATRWLADDSTINISSDHICQEASDEQLVLLWINDDGSLIHTTTYRSVPKKKRK